MTALFAPPTDAASLYFGDVMHARMKPVGHRFAYKVFTLLIDVDRLAEASRLSTWFSTRRFNLLSFCQQDHGAGRDEPLRTHVEELLQPTGQSYDRILLFCYPRVLGFVFNPISVYFCYRRDELAAVIYEVRNTFGQIHSYIAPVADGELDETGLKQERAKCFHVSPFMDMDLTYKFRLRPPGENIGLRILETDAQGPILAATFTGLRRSISNANVLRAFFGLPLMTLKVVGGIHWEALKLWMKGVRLRSIPAPPPRSSMVPLTPAELAKG